MSTKTLIQTISVGAGGAASIDFTSIPATFDDLVLELSARNTADTPDAHIAFNGVSTSMADKWLYGNGSAAGSLSNAGIYFEMVRSTYTANVFSSTSIYIPNYRSANYKSVSIETVTENNAAGALMLLDAGLWSNTSAINQITLVPDSGSFAQYSLASLYGIKNS